jgi:hypothetical protein
MGGVIGRGAAGGDASRVGVSERERELDPRRPRRLRSGEARVKRFVGDPEKLAARSVLVLVVLLDPRRLRNGKGNGLDDGKDGRPLDGPGHDVCCVTIEESRLYAGVVGSGGLSISTGNDAEA